MKVFLIGLLFLAISVPAFAEVPVVDEGMQARVDNVICESQKSGLTNDMRIVVRGVFNLQEEVKTLKAEIERLKAEKKK